MSPRVSVVIPTYRRPQLLDRVLGAIADQSLPSEEFEVVVVDDAANEGTQAQVAAWARRTQVRFRYAPVLGSAHGPAAARNIGWRAARGEIIAFTDDDTVPDRDWLRAGLAAFTPGVSGVGGRIVVPLPPRPTDYERDASHLQEAEFATANCFYRRSVLSVIGGFDERFTAAWREYSDLYLTLLERGLRCIRAPDAVVVHPIRPARWAVSLSQQRKSQFNALLYKKHPRLYRERVEPSQPWRYYATVSSATTALLAGMLGRRASALTAFGFWLGLTGHFCGVRLAGNSRKPRHVAEMALTSAVIPFLSLLWRIRGAIKYRVAFL